MFPACTVDVLLSCLLLHHVQVPGQCEDLVSDATAHATFGFHLYKMVIVIVYSCVQGMSMEAIATQRTLQLGTVQSYIAEAMTAGYAYPWHRMGLPHCILASLCSHVRAYHKQLMQQEGGLLQHPCQLERMSCQEPDMQQPQWQTKHQQHGSMRTQQQLHQQEARQSSDRLGQAQTSHATGSSAFSAQAAAQHYQATTGPAGMGSGADAASCLDVPLIQAQAVCHECGLSLDQGSAELGSSGLVHMPNQKSTDRDTIARCGGGAAQLPEMSGLTDLVLTGKGTKALRDGMQNSTVTYGHMRLALAHMHCLLRNTVCSCKPKS